MFWQKPDEMHNLNADVEGETLQTDIQRFLAILGFCLMAVFALVQAIPVTGSGQNEVNIEKLEQQIKKQQEGLKGLNAENSRLKEEVARLKSYAQDKRPIAEDLKGAKKELEAQGKRIEELLDQKLNQEKDLVDLRNRLTKRSQEIEELKSENEKISQRLRDIQAQLKAPPQKEQAPTTGGKEGLYIAFDSEKAILKLLSSGRIVLFIKLKDLDQAFRIVEKGDGFRFDGTPLPKDLDFWEIKEAMVPTRILSAFKSWTSLATREKIFIVGFPIALSREIRKRSGKTGRIIIQPDGTLRFEP